MYVLYNHSRAAHIGCVQQKIPAREGVQSTRVDCIWNLAEIILRAVSSKTPNGLGFQQSATPYFHSKEIRSNIMVYNKLWLLSYQIIKYRLNYDVLGCSARLPVTFTLNQLMWNRPPSSGSLVTRP